MDIYKLILGLMAIEKTIPGLRGVNLYADHNVIVLTTEDPLPDTAAGFMTSVGWVRRHLDGEESDVAWSLWI